MCFIVNTRKGAGSSYGLQLPYTSQCSSRNVLLPPRRDHMNGTLGCDASQGWRVPHSSLTRLSWTIGSHFIQVWQSRDFFYLLKCDESWNYESLTFLITHEQVKSMAEGPTHISNTVNLHFHSRIQRFLLSVYTSASYYRPLGSVSPPPLLTQSIAITTQTLYLCINLQLFLLTFSFLLIGCKKCGTINK